MAQMKFKDYGLLFNSAGERVARIPVFSYSVDLSSYSTGESIQLNIEGINLSDYDFSQATHSYIKKLIPSYLTGTYSVFGTASGVSFDQVISTKVFPAIAIGKDEGVSSTGDRTWDFIFYSETSCRSIGMGPTGTDWTSHKCAFFYNEFYGLYTLGPIMSSYTLIGKEQFTSSNYKVPTIMLESDYPEISSMSIRCPDSVRQGLFIFICCDSPEYQCVPFTCTLSGNTSSMTKLMQVNDRTVRLQCGSDETGSLTIQAEYQGDAGITASKSITVIPYDGGGGGGNGGEDDYDPTSSVTGITLSVFPETVLPGRYAAIYVTVNGVGDYSQKFTAQISGHNSADTQLVAGGYSCNLWVSEDETADSILVSVASVQDPTVTASAVVMVNYSGTEEDPTTEEPTTEELQQTFWNGYSAARAHFRKLKLSATVTFNITRGEEEPSTRAGKLKRAFWLGFVSGTANASEIENTDLEPVAYLYNGMRCAALHEDVNTYPYALMRYIAENSKDQKPIAHLYLMSEPAIYKGIITGYHTSGTYVMYSLVTDLSTWENYQSALALPETMTEANVWCFNKTASAASGSTVQLISGLTSPGPNWANHDVMYNESVKIAGSEPVPVYA